MAVENGYGAELEMVVDEENHNTSADNEKGENVKKIIEEKDVKVEEASVVMEVDEVQETDPLADNESEDRVITARNDSETDRTKGNAESETPVDYTKKSNTANDIANNHETTGNNDSDSGNVSSTGSLPVKVKIKEEPASEVVLIDSEEEKDDKTKGKISARSMQLRQNPKPSSNYKNFVATPPLPTPQNRSSSDFQIVSVDDDSPMNKNDPMNVFLCSSEEREFRKDYFKDPSSNVLKQRLHCTICDIHIGACPQNSKNMVCHRFLKVLICRKCANFYGQGEFPQDEGSDEFCRWCGEGGEVFLCNTCSNVFCQACILRNFGMQEVKRVDRLENWDCYVCDPRPLWTLRAIAFALFTYVRRIKVVAYRNGMYQSVNSSNNKVSKSDLMALETDLSTCCPKEVKAAAAAASAAPPEVNQSSSNQQPPSTSNSTVSKGKDNAPNQMAIRPGPAASKVLTPNLSNNFVQSSPTSVYTPPRPSTSKRPGKSNTKPSAAQSWVQEQLSKYLPGPGRKVPVQQPFPPVPYPHQSPLRSALVGGQQPPSFLQNSFGSPASSAGVFGETNADGQSDPGVMQWFNGILASLMETIKNIENRLVFIRNSTSNLISQNEVSFLVNQLHNLLKVSSSKMQEVDCDLLKNYKEFIDKSEITVNDFDDIVREYPEFFKGTENVEEPESTENEPETPDDINPMALVEVIEEGDQAQPSSSGDAAKKKGDGDSGKRTKDSSDKPSKKGGATPSLSVKKEFMSNDDSVSADKKIGGRKSKETNNGVSKRRSDVNDTNQNGVKKVRYDNIKIKQETADDCDDGLAQVKL